MTYTRGDLNLTDPDRGYVHFVLYAEPDKGAVSAINASISVEKRTPLAREWFDRLERIEPNALHTTLVSPGDISKLFHACVYEDKDSPAAVGGSGCTCFQTFYDPEFRLPVIGNHFRTVSGNIETWTYNTYAPLDLRPNDRFGSLIIDYRSSGSTDFWIRTTDGLLSFLPEQEGHGYGIGYGGGGPGALAQYVQQLIASDGQDTAAINNRSSQVDDRISSWAYSATNARSQELTLPDLRRILDC
ncbi:hypothetical protein [Actinoallomurus sp. NPDC052274]|uniref:hypothetical protein n=1 Tax=Actinoallomurus sp. NPDC052274 TaxID=3155420 RepID=UPI0034171A16